MRLTPFWLCLAAILLVSALATAEEPAAKPLAEWSAEELDARVAKVSIDLKATRSEHSRDSNSQSYTIAIRGRQVTYDGPLGPSERGNSAQGNAKFDLDDDQLRELVADLGDARLKSIKHKKSTEVGPGVSVDVTFTLEDGKRSVHIRVAGVESDWEDESKSNLSEEADRAASAVFALAESMRRIADAGTFQPPAE